MTLPGEPVATVRVFLTVGFWRYDQGRGRTFIASWSRLDKATVAACPIQVDDAQLPLRYSA